MKQMVGLAQSPAPLVVGNAPTLQLTTSDATLSSATLDDTLESAASDPTKLQPVKMLTG
jgi:hypothetical protein